LREVCAAGLVVSREKIQSLVVGLQTDARATGRFGLPAEKFPANLLSSFTTLPGLPTICHSITGNERIGRLRMLKGMRCAIAGAIFLLASVSAIQAQQQLTESRDPNAPSAPQPAAGATPEDQKKAAEAPKGEHPLAPGVHSFWDRENDWLFAGVAAGRALDYASTLNLRRRGINEAFLTNSIVDNHPLFAGIEAAATAASVGVSYIFHRTGHHRLERWTSAIHIGVATGGAIRNYALKTPHPI
jgi:hypothetical protein